MARFKRSLNTLLSIRSPLHVIPALFSVLTQRPRQIVKVGRDFNWSGTLWTHNVFRVYEVVFGRGGRWSNGVADFIRCESGQGVDENGNVSRRAFTFESHVKFLEADVRALFKRLATVRVYVLKPVPQYEIPRLFPYLLAIAFGSFTKNATQSATPHTMSVTVSGSNTFLCTSAWRPANATTPTSVVFNTSENATKSTTDTSTPDNGYYGAEIWYLFGATATTANNVYAFSGGGNAFQYSLQYTGVVNTNTSGTSAGEASYSSLAAFRSFTPTTANGWVLWFGSGDGSIPSGVYNSTGTYRASVGSDWCAADSGGTVAVSAVSYGYTNASGTKGSLSILGFGNDSAAATATGNTLLMMGV